MAEFRDATPADAHAIATVHVESWRGAYRGLMPDDVLAGLSVPAREQRWLDALTNPPPRTCTVLATTGTSVLGFASIGPARNIDDSDPVAGELYAIYLVPAVWSRGIGTRLHAAALRRLRSFDFDRASLWVLDGNERALRFYSREGWADTGHSKLERGPHDSELHERLLHRSLAG